MSERTERTKNTAGHRSVMAEPSASEEEAMNERSEWNKDAAERRERIGYTAPFVTTRPSEVLS